MKRPIEAPRVGERPDAGLATLAIQSVLQGQGDLWQRLPENVIFSIYDRDLRPIVQGASKSSAITNAGDGQIHIRPKPNSPKYVHFFNLAPFIVI